jgi:polysaccharide export outer membrane protein
MPASLHGLPLDPDAGTPRRSPGPFPPPVTRRATLLGLAAALAACGLPQQGPRTPTIVEGATDNRYVLIDVDAAIVQRLGKPRRTSLSGFGKAIASQPTQSVGIGDVLDIRILEAGSGGLFATSNGGAGGTSFPGIVVDRQGRITLPYVGSIAVAGQTPGQIETRIVDALRGKAIEPQALVRVTETDGNTLTLSGDIANPGPFAISLRGSRLSEAIASGGGSRFPAHETRVTLIREGRRADARLDDILLDPQSDIAVQRRDLIVLTHEPPRFTLTGSVGQPGTFTLAGTEYSVLEAVSAAGGPSDSRADASGVFLFRYEPRDRLVAAGRTPPDGIAVTATGIPTVYRFDMGQPDMQFHARQFGLADGDALYVSNAGTVQLGKILSLFDLGLTATNRVRNATD